jgi:hypothetical protein
MGRSPDGLVNVATGYGLDDREVGMRVPVGSRFSLLNVIQTDCEVHSTSYPVVTGSFFLGCKAAGA